MKHIWFYSQVAFSATIYLIYRLQALYNNEPPLPSWMKIWLVMMWLFFINIAYIADKK